MRRQLLWLFAGILAVPVLLVVTAPELMGADLSATAGLVAPVLIAGVPGLVIVAMVAVRRRGRHHVADEPDLRS